MTKKEELILLYLKNLEARQSVIKNQFESIALEIEYNDLLIKDIKTLLETEGEQNEDTIDQ